MSWRQRRRRGDLVRKLVAYRAAGLFPRNDLFARRTPFFIDHHGTRCAMAHLIEASGHGSFVERVAASHNNARVGELRGEELDEWLLAHGLTLDEAARIQPTYSRTWGLSELCSVLPEGVVLRATLIDDETARVTSLFDSKTTVKVGQMVKLAKPGTIEYPDAMKKGADVLLRFKQRRLVGENGSLFVPIPVKIESSRVADLPLPVYVKALRSPDCPNALADLKHLPKDKPAHSPPPLPPSPPPIVTAPSDISSASVPPPASAAPSVPASSTRHDAPLAGPSGCDCAVPTPAAPAVGDVALLACALALGWSRRAVSSPAARRRAP